MESIDRLRRYVECHDKITGLTATCINHLIDSIDKDVDDMWHALTIDAKPMTDENMAESGWVRLPVDADGVPIHVGDVMVYDHDGVRTSVPEAVKWIAVGEYETHITTEYNSYSMPSVLRHHRAPTVEDVLREFYVYAERGKEHHREDVDDAVLAEYAAKLRLAGEDE